MKSRSIVKICAAALCLTAPVLHATAQTTVNRSAYFLKGSAYRHQLNPAFIGDRGYFSLPMLGNLSFDVRTTAGAGTFIYDLGNDSLGTFMHPDVDAKEFTDNLPKRIRISQGLREEIFSYGRCVKGGYFTFGIALREDLNVNLPSSLFKFMKLGMDSEGGNTYHLNNLRINAQAFAEFSLGYARQINNRLVVGAKVKPLLGLGNADLRIDRMDITATDSRWAITTRGAKLSASMTNLDIPTKGETGNYVEQDYVLDADGERTDQLKPGVEDEISWEDIGMEDDWNWPKKNGKYLSGGGVAFDLGASYRWNDFTFSAALLDLGFIHWKNTTTASMAHSFEFDGFDDIVVDSEEGENSIEEQGTRIADDLYDIARFKLDGRNKSRNRMLGATLNLGAEYTLPMYDRLSVGFLSSTYIKGPESWTEGRFSLNIAPTMWFDASFNYAISNFGSTAGAMLNIHPRGFNLFIAADAPLGKLSKKYYAPLGRAAANVNIGINFPFGKRYHRRYPVEEVQSL